VISKSSNELRRREVEVEGKERKGKERKGKNGWKVTEEKC